MSKAIELHSTVKHGDLAAIKALLDENRELANSRSKRMQEVHIHFTLRPSSARRTRLGCF